MAKGYGFAQAAAEGINGYIRGMQIKRQMDEEDDNKAWRNEQRTNARTDRAREDQLRTDLTAATAPATVDTGAGGVTKPATADNSDVGQPGEPGAASGGLIPGSLVNGLPAGTPAQAGAAAAGYNSPDAENQRLVAAYRKNGKPMEAAKLNTDLLQGKTAQFTLDKAIEDRLNADFDKKLSGVTDISQAGDVMSSIAGKPVTVVKSADGKQVSFVTTGPDGQQTAIGKSFSNDRKGLQEFITANSKVMTSVQKIEAMRHMDDLEERANQHIETVRHNKASEGIAQEHVGIAREQLGISRQQLGIASGHLALDRDKYNSDLKNDPLRNLPGGDKLAIGIKSKEIDAIDAQLNKAQMDPTFDPKAPGVIALQGRRLNLVQKRDEILSKYVSGYKAADGAYPLTAPSAPTTPAGKAVAAAGAGTWHNPAMAVPAAVSATAPTGAAATGIPAEVPRTAGGLPMDPNARARPSAAATVTPADISAAASAASQVKTPQDAYNVIGMRGFNSLPPEDQARLVQMVK